jgi:hypothetical protein
MCHASPWPLVKMYMSISQNDKLVNLNPLKIMNCNNAMNVDQCALPHIATISSSIPQLENLD